MPSQAIHTAVMFLQGRGHTVTPVDADRWHVRITFPHFPSLTIDDQITSAQLMDAYAALSGQALPYAEEPRSAGRVQ